MQPARIETSKSGVTTTGATAISNINQDLLRTFKAQAGAPGPPLLIPVGMPPIAFLRPVATSAELLRDEDVQVLTEWRNRHVQSFLTEFVATKERTARWLVDMVGTSNGRILFMVDDTSGNTFGYMGLDFIDWGVGYGEADAVVRGREAAHGTMKVALLSLMAWARGHLGLRRLGVRVRSDNAALGFYHKVGFREVRRVPLRRLAETEMIRWVEDDSLQNNELELVYMVWS